MSADGVMLNADGLKLNENGVKLIYCAVPGRSELNANGVKLDPDGVKPKRVVCFCSRTV